MKRLCIVPCGSRKIWQKNPNAGATRAKDVYIGPFAKKCIEYAEKFHLDHYRILSAKYGLVSPDFLIPQNYDISFSRRSGLVISMERLREQILDEGLTKRYREIIVLGGHEYVSRITAIFDHSAIHTPLAACKGIGFMMQKLNGSLLRGKPLV